MSKPAALVVEDEVVMRMDTMLIFEDVGYEALEAANADDAWRILLERDDIILLLTDIDMPGHIDGLELANRVHSSWPGIEVVVCSGRVCADDVDLPKPVLFLGKPVDRMSLEDKARQTVQAKGLA